MLYKSFKTKLIVLISCYIMILIEINLSKTYLINIYKTILNYVI